MLNEDEIKTVVDCVIDVAAKSNQHPYTVLVGIVRILQMEEMKEKEIINKCKTILKSRSCELPWSL